MKKEQLQKSTMKYKLSKMRREGKKSVIWALNCEQLEFIRNLGYDVIPQLYRIYTKEFPNVRYIKTPLIKEVHYKHKEGKWCYVRKLSKSDVASLKEFGVRCLPSKYLIVLH